MNKDIVEISSLVEPSEYGGKAHWLSWLFRERYNVPYSVFLPAVDSAVDIFEDRPQFDVLKKLLRPVATGDKYNVAIRSSATLEDAYSRSFAGHFKTITGLMTINEILGNVRQVINSLKGVRLPVPMRMGIVIQKYIKAKFSGIAFSSNPITGSKYQCIISVIQGAGAALVSGQTGGEEIVLTADKDNVKIPAYSTRISAKYLKEIWQIAKEIEDKLGFPVDIEWCIEQKERKLYLLQCRPATGILWDGDPVVQVSQANEKRLPPNVLKNEKVLLRLLGEKAGVLVSQASILTINSVKGTPIIPDLSTIRATSDCRSYSAVLIYPQTLDGKVLRSFIACSESSHTAFHENQRYSVISYPEYGTLEECVAKIAGQSGKQYWASSIIIQEIFDPKYAGIIKKIKNSYLIEVAFGHFVPKGVVPTSQYIVNLSGELSYSHEVHQDKCFRILDGHVLEEKIDSSESLISLPRATISQIVHSFEPFVRDNRTAVEFGLLENLHDKTLTPYLIDLVQDTSKTELDSEDVSEGVISKGTITGKLLIYDLKNSEALNFHFHDDIGHKSTSYESYIYLCPRPDISLLKMIQQHPPGKIGFIFREGSILCHLAIILREQGIPAIISKSKAELTPGEMVTIDALTPNLDREKRVFRYF